MNNDDKNENFVVTFNNPSAITSKFSSDIIFKHFNILGNSMIDASTDYEHESHRTLNEATNFFCSVISFV